MSEVNFMRIVQKYGGSSLADPQCIRNAARRIATFARQGHQLIVVVSAQGDTTDYLLEQLTPFSPTPREQDAFLSVGEQQSAALMAMALQELGLQAVSLNAQQMGLRTDSRHTDALITHLDTPRIEEELRRGNIVVATGFQGVSPSGDITTLGRGGSDTTAVALAALLDAESCMIYTDVDGVYDKDPRRHPDAKRFDAIDYDQMLTLAQQGAQVLHDRCIILAQQHHIPILVLSSFRPGPGTLVTEQ
jgi:aspartate kinase